MQISPAFISKLTLTNFRNFSARSIEFSPTINLLTGSNGVGKTNILEALTLLGRNQSLCGSSLEEMLFCDSESQQKKPQFVVHSKISDHDFIEKIAVSFELGTKKKNLYINDEALNSKRQSDVNQQLVNFIFITPQIEQLFILGKSARRDYLDKIVSDLDSKHSTRLNQYQKLLRERLAILQKYGNKGGGSEKKWLEIVETNIAELGTTIASARIEAVNFFNKAIITFSSNFPKSELQINGEVESELLNHSALQLEEFYRKKLEENRQKDFENFRTEFGVHRSDFDAIFLLKKTSAMRSSTGEQKAIMLGITLARAKISATYKNQPTALIFDEVMSHLDDKRKLNLLDEIEETQLQSFCSATSVELLPHGYDAKEKMEEVAV